jgi:hypothetical protein
MSVTLQQLQHWLTSREDEGRAVSRGRIKGSRWYPGKGAA